MSLRALIGGLPASTIDNYDLFDDGSGVALYMFEDNALDESGNYNMASLSNVVYENGINGRGARATSTTGAVLPTSYNTTNFTINFWIKENIQAKKICFQFKSGNTSVHNQVYFLNYDTSRRVSVMVYEYNSNIQNTVTYGTEVYPDDHGVNFGGTPVAGKLNEWYMVTATYNGTTLNAYEDGVLIGSANIGSGWSLTGGVISCLSYGYGETLDQARVFNRALTLTEIQQLYTEGA